MTESLVSSKCIASAPKIIPTLIRRHPVIAVVILPRICTEVRDLGYYPRPRRLRGSGWHVDPSYLRLAQHQRAGEHVVNRLALFGKARDDVADSQGNHSGNKFRKVPPGRSRERDSRIAHIGH